MSGQLQEDDEKHDLKGISTTPKRKMLSSDDNDGDREENEDEDDLRPFSTASRGKFSHDDYTVGWICALHIEMAAAKAMLDEIHSDLKNHPNDNNTYVLGRISGHNIVIACLPEGEYGISPVATVASQMQVSFRSVRFYLMVGIGGGVPSEKADIRLGDVVVGIPTSKHGGVVQYNDEIIKEGYLERIGTLKKPPILLLLSVSRLRDDHYLKKSQIPAFLSEIPDKYPAIATDCTYCGQEQDLFFAAEYDHVESKQTCEDCDKSRLIVRPSRIENSPMIHYGLVASGAQSMKHGHIRDRLAQELGILCFETEAAGLMDNFPCLVIRGICDYADSHKNNKWQEYAAATAAAYTKELLSTIPVISGTNGEQRQFFTDALNFAESGFRQMNVRTAHANTCNWLFSNSEYQDWLDSNKISQHHGLLWIKGKPGTGKSTIMKFALDHTKTQMKKETVVISFFFNIRGNDLERSAIGMYRSLLYQLLEKVPELQNILGHLGSPPDSSKHHQWNIEILQNLLRGAIVQCRQRRLMCFIDALDECEEDQARDIVTFFEDLGQLSVSAYLRICFSSRHYLQITTKKSQQLVLEWQEGHNQDIANYIYSRLNIGSSKQADEARMEILERASGIFLWVVAVVSKLNKEYARGLILELHKRFQEIPDRINDLWKDTLIRDHRNIVRPLLCLQWILYAKRPLKQEELYFAIISGEDPRALPSHSGVDVVTEGMAERFLIDSSKGLAEVTRTKDQTVHFIHGSVRDFFLKENGLRDLWPGFVNKGNNFPSLSHEQLKKCCYNYMKIATSEHLPANTPLPNAKSAEAVKLRQLIAERFPFIEYAVHNVLYHADIAESGGVSQDAFIENFPLRDWITLDNLFEGYEIRRHTPEASLLYILAEKDLPNLIRIHLRRVSNIDIQGERYYFPIFAALANRNENAVRALLTSDTNLQSNSDIPHNLYSQSSQDLSALLGYGREIKPRKDRTLLSYAAEYGDAPIVQQLLATGQVDPDFKDSNERTPLSYAAENGHEAVVKLLLETNRVNPDFRDSNGRTPLSYAAENGHEAVAKLLLAREVDSKVPETGPLTDTGHASIMASKLNVDSYLPTEDGYISQMNSAASDAQVGTYPKSDDARTVYSDAPSLPSFQIEGFIKELADSLVNKVLPEKAGNTVLGKFLEVLPQLLKAFALRLGHQAPSQMHRDVMFFVHKYRR
jgi:nucleoside phosphorylase